MIKTIKVGGKFPTNMNFTSASYEVEYEIPEGETLEQATAKCKLLVATQVAGSDAALLRTALKVLNYPSQSDEIEQVVAELSKINSDLLKLRRELRSKQKYVAELLTISAKLDELQAITHYFETAGNFWGIVQEIAESVERNRELLDDDENNDDQPTLSPAKEEF